MCSRVVIGNEFYTQPVISIQQTSAHWSSIIEVWLWDLRYKALPFLGRIVETDRNTLRAYTVDCQWPMLVRCSQNEPSRESYVQVMHMRVMNRLTPMLDLGKGARRFKTYHVVFWSLEISLVAPTQAHNLEFLRPWLPLLPRRWVLPRLRTSPYRLVSDAPVWWLYFFGLPSSQ